MKKFKTIVSAVKTAAGAPQCAVLCSPEGSLPADEVTSWTRLAARCPHAAEVLVEVRCAAHGRGLLYKCAAHANSRDICGACAGEGRLAAVEVSGAVHL